MIVAGGTPGNSQLPIREVDILDYGSNAWRLGTPLPVGIYGGASITDPLGGFIVAGGSTEFSFALTSKIYRLRNALPDTKWELLPISLDGPRGNLFATPIPDSLVTCKPGKYFFLVGGQIKNINTSVTKILTHSFVQSSCWNWNASRKL